MFDGETTPTKTLTIDVATAAIKGARGYQEDSIIASFPMGQDAGFAVIADGMGGQVAGHLASALVSTQVFTHLKMLEPHLLSGALDVPFALREAAEQANKRVADHVAKNQDKRGMGSTLLVPVIRGDRLSWLSIGDSPLYLLRNGALRQLNQNHSMAPQIDMMVKSGSLSAEKGKDHPSRNKLTSVINGETTSAIDCPASPILLKGGDILVAATDGLQSLSSSVIAKVLVEGVDQTSNDIAQAFLRDITALEHPDQDNTTFVVMKVIDEARGDNVMDLDAMPILAQADGASDIPAPQPSSATAASEPDERKAYFYRGQKYYRD